MRMAFHFRLDKVLAIREKEKNLSELEYADAQKQFERAAWKLYELLKKKENLEAQYSDKMQAGVTVNVLRQYHDHLESLQGLIIQEQLNVNRAKFEMERKQEVIVQKSVEVKKYTSLKDKHYAAYTKQLKQDENKQLDELIFMKPGEQYGV